MELGIDPTIAADCALSRSSKHWHIDEVARLQDALGRVPPLAMRGNGDVATAAAAPAPQPVLGPSNGAETHRDLSGRYRGGDDLQLELRVDIDGPRPLRRISGDFHRVSGSTAQYVGSFVVNAPVVHPGTTEVVLEGDGEFSMTTAAPRVRVTIPRAPVFMTPPAATVQFTNADGVMGASYRCQFQSPFFRRVEFELDRVASVQPLSQFDVSLLPSGGPPRVLTVARAFAEAGVEMVDTGQGGSIPDGANGADGVWTNAELHASMEANFSAWSDAPGWKVWLLAATMHQMGPGLRGIMFDQSGRQRQGCAVFHSAIGSGTNEITRGMLRTYVHELGHCFNLYHSHQKEYMTPPQPNRLDALSWMHYPAYYQSPNGNGEAAYWAAFPFQFDELELIHLRHGFQNAVIMGGDDFGIGAADVDPRLFQGLAVDRSGYALELRGPRKLVIGTPVVVELKLTSTDKRAKPANAHIHPNLGYVQVGIARPGGKTVLYRPFLQSCANPDPIVLDDQKNPAVYDSAYIGYGRDGFYFDAPGHYEVRAVYHAADGSKVYSNVLRIWVRDPMDEDEEHIAELYLGDDQGRLLTLLGSDAAQLDGGNAALDEIIERFPNHPMSVYAFMVKGVNAARAFKTVAGNRVRVRQPDSDAGEKMLASVVGRSAQPPPGVAMTTAETAEVAFTPRVGVDNITLSMVFDELARVQLQKGDVERARNTLESRQELFKDRDVPRHVLRQLGRETRARMRSASTPAEAPPVPTEEP